MHLVLGGSGLVGSSIVRTLLAEGHAVAYTYGSNPVALRGAEAHHLDVTRPGAMARLMGELRPEVVVNTIALPSVDRYETDPGLAEAVTVRPAREVAALCREHGSNLVYISTAFVFGEGRVEPYTEDDSPGPVNRYGKAKLLAEEHTRSVPEHLVLRTDQIYGWSLPGQKQCFVERVLAKLDKGEEASEALDWSNCPTFVRDIAGVLAALLRERLWGTYHVAGPDFLSRHEWALKIARTFGLDAGRVKGMSASSYGLPARRPNCALSSRKAEAAAGVRLLGVEAGLRAMRESRGLV